MFLIHLLKILFEFFIICHAIRWVSYHIRNRNKKTRVFHGNTRMPKELEFALLYGLTKRRKKRFKDVSYRKPLNEWMQMLDTIYTADNLNSTHQSQTNSNFATHKFPKRDFGVECFTNGNRKQFLFPKFKTGDNDLVKIKKIYNVFTAKLCAKNNGLVSSLLVKAKIDGTTNLKIYKNTSLFPKQIFACTCPIFTVWFSFISFR